MQYFVLVKTQPNMHTVHALFFVDSCLGQETPGYH